MCVYTHTTNACFTGISPSYHQAAESDTRGGTRHVTTRHSKLNGACVCTSQTAAHLCFEQGNQRHSGTTRQRRWRADKGVVAAGVGLCCCPPRHLGGLLGAGDREGGADGGNSTDGNPNHLRLLLLLACIQAWRA